MKLSSFIFILHNFYVSFVKKQGSSEINVRQINKAKDITKIPYFDNVLIFIQFSEANFEKGKKNVKFHQLMLLPSSTPQQDATKLAA